MSRQLFMVFLVQRKGEVLPLLKIHYKEVLEGGGKQVECTNLGIARSDHLLPVHDTVRHTEIYARYARYQKATTGIPTGNVIFVRFNRTSLYQGGVLYGF